MPGRPWTKKQELLLIEMRRMNPPMSLKECAKTLNRTVNAISRKLHDLKIVIQPHLSFDKIKWQITESIDKYRHRGTCDALLALKLRRSKSSVRIYRKRLNKKAAKPPGWAQGQDRRRPRIKRYRCLNCNVLCPISFSVPGWEELTGWACRILNDSIQREVYCPECFNRWGWHDDPRRRCHER